MTVMQLDAVLAIEQVAYSVPWTRGNFIDSIASGYEAWLLMSPDQGVLGYFIAMDGYEEMHLLNLTVAPAVQGQGHGRAMLDRLVDICRARDALQLWLEVRESNDRARALYQRYGFVPVGVRRDYYPLPPGVPGREDAVVMSLKTATTE